ncbi:MAG: excinuclease ABC subunit UvrC [Thermodesulfobacteriota bacterium]
MKTKIAARLKNLPTLPGVYLMKGARGEVIYVGKAKNLKSRVRSYFQGPRGPGGDGRYAVRFLASKTEDIDCIITDNEKEALFLEDTLLKQYKPRYNIRLKDSKTYVSIKITTAEKFPRILVTRQIKKDGSRYFGPYVSARSVRGTVKLMRRIFPLCVCGLSEFRNMTRACLDYQLGLCSAPAVGLITEKAYKELVDGAIMFLEGKNVELLRILKRRMKEAAKRLDFEEAARLRDQVSSVEGMLETQRVVTHSRIDQDIFALVREVGLISIQAVFVRGGRMVDSLNYSFRDTCLDAEEILSSFVTQFYRSERFIPGEVIAALRPGDRKLIEEWLCEKGRRKVRVVAPIRGDKLKLLKLAERNALEAMRKKREEEPEESQAVRELQKRLRLKRPPYRIEAFDISNISGRNAVGAMVTFKNAGADKSGYRLFKIKEALGPDDYAMMNEVMSRRYNKAPRGGAPDLIIVDGGKGQLAVALRVLRELGLDERVEAAALAKDKPLEEKGAISPGAKRPSRGERVFLPNRKDPVLLKEGTRPDLLLRRIRDEVHRFAITYQRKLRQRDAMRSVLDDVAGIGPKRKQALYKRFGDIDGILGADIKDLMEVTGVTKETAERLKGLKKNERVF